MFRQLLSIAVVAAAGLTPTLVAAPAEAAGPVTVSFRDGRLVVRGTAAGDQIRLVRKGSKLVVKASSRVVRHGRQATTHNTRSVRIDGGRGQDDIRVRVAVRRLSLNGGPGNDTLVGSSRNDVLHGNTGNDVLMGQLGNDALYGDDGNDVLLGQEGHDTLSGGAGNDSLQANSGRNVLRGGPGDDHYHFDPTAFLSDDLVVESAGQGTDEVRFYGTDGVTFSLASAATQTVDGPVKLRLSSGMTVENVHGSLGADQLTGNALANTLNGGQGDDTLTGGAGVDRIVPGDGSGDWLDGEVFALSFGNDTLTDFADEDIVALYDDQTVEGLGTETASITGQRDSGSLHAPGHAFVAGDFAG